jgi:hypothetical protein
MIKIKHRYYPKAVDDKHAFMYEHKDGQYVKAKEADEILIALIELYKDISSEGYDPGDKARQAIERATGMKIEEVIK